MQSGEKGERKISKRSWTRNCEVEVDGIVVTVIRDAEKPKKFNARKRRSCVLKKRTEHESLQHHQLQYIQHFAMRLHRKTQRRWAWVLENLKPSLAPLYQKTSRSKHL
jgi:hypothetical protein